MTTAIGSNITNNASGASASVSAAVSSRSVGSVVAAGAAAVCGVVGIATTIASLIPAMLYCKDFTQPTALGLVPFDFNPQKISITRCASTCSR